MPHRRGTFRENWDELLQRFAHRGTPAAREDQLRAAAPQRQFRDVHQLLFKGSQPDRREPDGTKTNRTTSRESRKSSSNC